MLSNHSKQEENAKEIRIKILEAYLEEKMTLEDLKLLGFRSEEIEEAFRNFNENNKNKADEFTVLRKDFISSIDFENISAESSIDFENISADENTSEERKFPSQDFLPSFKEASQKQTSQKSFELAVEENVSSSEFEKLEGTPRPSC